MDPVKLRGWWEGDRRARREGGVAQTASWLFLPSYYLRPGKLAPLFGLGDGPSDILRAKSAALRHFNWCLPPPPPPFTGPLFFMTERVFLNIPESCCFA